MMTRGITRERQILIEDYRRDHPAECLGLPNDMVEARAFALGDCSTEALVSALHERGYAVVLEVGG